MVCGAAVAVPVSIYLTSSSVPFALRLAGFRSQSRSPVDVVCSRCATTRPELFRESNEGRTYVWSSLLTALLLSFAVAILLVYPALGEPEIWRWNSLRWPQTDGGMLGVLGVLATVLLAMGVDLAQQDESIGREASVWVRGGRGLRLAEFRRLSRQMERLALTGSILRISSGAAFAVGGVALGKAVFDSHIESALTGAVAAIIVVVGRAMTSHRVNISRHDLELTAAGAIVNRARAWRTAAAWRREIGDTPLRRAWIPAVSIVFPVILALGALPFVGWLAAGAVLAVQVATATVALACAALRAEVVVGRPGMRLGVAVAVVILLLADLIVIYVAAVGYFRICGWVGFWAVLGGCVASTAGALWGLFKRLPFGGGLMVALVRFVPHFRSAATSPELVDSFFIVVSPGADRDLLQHLTGL